MKVKTVILALAILLLGMVNSSAQDTPPPGHTDSCDANQIMYTMFGPHCLNPVTWNVDGIVEPDTTRIGEWIWFRDDDGFNVDGGVVDGYVWDRFTQKYSYRVMVEPEHDDVDAEYKHVDVIDVYRPGNVIVIPTP